MWSVVVVLAAGCATPRLGAPPADADLRNDGSDAEKQRLYDEYAIFYENGEYVRSKAEGKVEDNAEVLPRAPAASDDARRYIAASDEARRIYDSPLLVVHRTVFAAFPWIERIGMLGSFLTGGLIGAGVGLAFEPLVGTFILWLPGAAIGAFVSLASCVLCCALLEPNNLGLTKLAFAFFVRESYEDVAEAFNRDLESRIADGAGAGSSVAPTATPPASDAPGGGGEPRAMRPPEHDAGRALAFAY